MPSNMQAAKILHEGFIKGALDVLEAMAGASFTHEMAAVQPVNEAALNTSLTACPVMMSGRIENSLGSVALLFPIAVAGRIAALIAGESAEDKTALSPGELSTLKEVGEPMLGGGVTSLMQQFKRPVSQLEQISLQDTGLAATGALLETLDYEATQVRFTFRSEGFGEAEAVSLCSTLMESLVPAGMLDKPVADAPPPPLVSQAEMNDILSGFAAPASAAGASGGGMSENISRILDIRLVAQARLGRVQLPISQILGLGPGSILDVGHLVDEPIELLVNDKLIARGDVVVVDEKFGLRITEIISPKERIESLH